MADAATIEETELKPSFWHRVDVALEAASHGAVVEIPAGIGWMLDQGSWLVNNSPRLWGGGTIVDKPISYEEIARENMESIYQAGNNLTGYKPPELLDETDQTINEVAGIAGEFIVPSAGAKNLARKGLITVTKDSAMGWKQKTAEKLSTLFRSKADDVAKEADDLAKAATKPGVETATAAEKAADVAAEALKLNPLSGKETSWMKRLLEKTYKTGAQTTAPKGMKVTLEDFKNNKGFYKNILSKEDINGIKNFGFVEPSTITMPKLSVWKAMKTAVGVTATGAVVTGGVKLASNLSEESNDGATDPTHQDNTSPHTNPQDGGNPDGSHEDDNRDITTYFTDLADDAVGALASELGWSNGYRRMKNYFSEMAGNGMDWFKKDGMDWMGNHPILTTLMGLMAGKAAWNLGGNIMGGLLSNFRQLATLAIVGIVIFNVVKGFSGTDAENGYGNQALGNKVVNVANNMFTPEEKRQLAFSDNKEGISNADLNKAIKDGGDLGNKILEHRNELINAGATLKLS